MKQKILIISVSAFFLLPPNYLLADSNKPVTDRDTLCSLEFGKYNDDSAYVGSTPMKDVCEIKYYESRKRVCEFNYKRSEIIAACIATYDAISYRIQNATE